MNTKNNDRAIIEGMRQAVRSASLDFCRAFNDLSGTDSAKIIRTIIDGQFRMADKLSQMQKDFSDINEETICPADVHEYLHRIGKMQ